MGLKITGVSAGKQRKSRQKALQNKEKQVENIQKHFKTRRIPCK
jgi:uncharacterized protein YmfQ (DUF2313 family)